MSAKKRCPECAVISLAAWCKAWSPCKVSFAPDLEGNSSKFSFLVSVCSSVVFAWMFCLVCGRFSTACSLSRLIGGNFRKHSRCWVRWLGCVVWSRQAACLLLWVGRRPSMGIPKLQWGGMEPGVVFLLIVCRT